MVRNLPELMQLLLPEICDVYKKKKEELSEFNKNLQTALDYDPKGKTN